MQMQQNSHLGQWPAQRSNSGGYHGPPPAKKARAGSVTAVNTTVTTNGTVITKYAPPPGWTPPIPPPTHHQAAPWQQPPQAYGYQQPVYPGHHQPYSHSISHPPPSYPTYPPQSAPPQNYPTQTFQAPIPQPQSQSVSQGYQAPTGTAFSHGRNASISHLPRPKSLPNNPYIIQTAAPQNITQDTIITREDGSTYRIYPLSLWELPLSEWPTPIEGDFHDDCHYAENPDEIVPSHSIGMIETHYALPTKRPIPATFQEAELEALAPRKHDPVEDESISRYFVNGEADEQLNTVRYSSAWAEIKDDMIFKEFSSTGLPTITRDEMAAKYRNRIDPNFFAVESPSPSPSPALAAIPEDADTNAGAMQLDAAPASNNSHRGSRQTGASMDDPLSNLELALQQTRPASRPMSSASHHSRASSVASGYSERITRPKQLAKINDAKQDEVLRMLGVEGSPQAVYETPGPAFGPRPSSTHSNHSHHSRHSSVGNAHQAARWAPPPPPYYGQSNSSFNNPWPHQNSNGNHRPTSSSSHHSNHHTQAGSDFDQDDMDATPRPKYNRTDSRKRSYQDDEPGFGDHNDFANDETPKQRHKQARVAPDVYRRRWER